MRNAYLKLISTPCVSKGGGELLMAHGLPLSDWAADAMMTRTFNTAGISNRGLAILAGNSMHIVSAFWSAHHRHHKFNQ